jgi:hypothetical protein
MRRRRGRRRDRESGTILLEFTLILPLLTLLAFGVMEFGLAWQARTTVQAGARTGVRTGSTIGSLAGADQEILRGIGSAINDLGLENVAWVLVFKSTTADGAVPPACLTPAPHGVSGSCNAYTGAQLRQVVAGTAPSSWFGCGGGALDAHWCPTARQSVQAIGGDYLGIWISATHDMLTGFFGSGITMTDRAVMRLEPAGI